MASWFSGYPPRFSIVFFGVRSSLLHTFFHILRILNRLSQFFKEQRVGPVVTSQGFHYFLGVQSSLLHTFFLFLKYLNLFCLSFLEQQSGPVVTSQGYHFFFGGSSLTFAYFFSFLKIYKPFLRFCYRTAIWSSGYQPRLSKFFWGFDPYLCIFFVFIFSKLFAFFISK